MLATIHLHNVSEIVLTRVILNIDNSIEAKAEESNVLKTQRKKKYVPESYLQSQEISIVIRISYEAKSSPNGHL